MKFEGGCYCGALRYEAEGDPVFNGQCHCRECQYITGGDSNIMTGMPKDGFKYTKGEPTIFRRGDIDAPVTREFCGQCGTPILSRAPQAPGVALIKVGTMDNPEIYGGPDVAIFMDDSYDHHVVKEGVATFPKGLS